MSDEEADVVVTGSGMRGLAAARTIARFVMIGTVGGALPQSCGEGACGTCRVRVLSGAQETDDRGMFQDGPAAVGVRVVPSAARRAAASDSGLSGSAWSFAPPFRPVTSSRRCPVA
ncbi:2Fe-2S iron-sulfur cluster-binding protein [Streptomyces fuscichromogenes]|uniref:2Fe-2S iron-sulfur cluster-binding protein n=1 Tax=Streptomyces fuscichromogenes TaxID=1324013 RepID=UPI0016704110|nr:2Fe-2S iron-sulfur cluster-binding protein [Streptomyces fuscichromogenes]